MKRLLAAAATTVATMVAVATAHGTGSVQTASSAGFVNSSDGIHLWAPMHTAPQAFRSESAAVDAAKRFDLITFNPSQLGGYAAAMKAANPNLKLFVYLNGTFLYRRLAGTVPTSITDPAWARLSGALVDKKRSQRIRLADSTRAFRFVTLWISAAPASAVGTAERPGHVSVNELELFPAR